MEILDADLTVTPSMSTSLTLNDLNVLISADNLFDALSSNLFVPTSQLDMLQALQEPQFTLLTISSIL